MPTLSPRRGWVGALVLVAAIGCNRAEPTVGRTDASPPEAGSWIAIERSDSLHWFFDSATVLRSPGRIYAWFAVLGVDSSGATMMNDPFQRFETWQELDCGGQLARGLGIRTPDSTGRVFVTPVRDSAWKEFKGYIIPMPALTAVCTYLTGGSS